MSGVNYRGRARLRDQQATERLSALLEGVAERTEHRPDTHEPEPDAGEMGSRHREPVAGRRFFARPAFIVLSVVLLAVCGVSALSLLPGSSTPEPVVMASVGSSGSAGEPTGAAPSGNAAARAPASEAASISRGAQLTVHVVGEVREPSVVQLNPGSRVIDAVKAAGGLTDGAVTERVNLAQPLTDGQQVLIPGQDTAASAPVGAIPGGAVSGGAAPVGPGATPGAPGGLAAGGAAGGPVNINTASAAELEALPRVGPVLAQRIVDFRTEHGPFTDVAELDDVSGVGTAMMEALAPLVTV